MESALGSMAAEETRPRCPSRVVQGVQGVQVVQVVQVVQGVQGVQGVQVGGAGPPGGDR